MQVRTLNCARIPVALAWTVLALTTCALAQAPGAATRPAAHPAISDLAQLTAELAAADGEPAPGSPAVRLGAAVKAADEFVHLAPEKQAGSELLTEHSRGLPEASAGRQWLVRHQKLRREHWYSQLVDMRFAEDTLAAAFVVHVPKPTGQPKQVEALYLVRRGDRWQVSLDIDADIAAMAPDAKALLVDLKSATEGRLKELTDLLSRPPGAPLPVRGTWTTHFRQSTLFLSFDGVGEVALIQVDGHGNSRFSVRDYHVADGQIVIEAHTGAVRLKVDPARGWDQDGQRHYCLVTENPRVWFPECGDEVLYFNPVLKGDWPVRRPVPQRPDGAGR